MAFKVTHNNRLENYRIGAIVIILSLFCFLVYYFQIHSGKIMGISYLYLTPVFLTSIWFKRKTWLAPVLLAGILISIQVLARGLGVTFSDDYFFLVMFIFAVVTVAFLSERIEKVRSLNKMNQKLENERQKLEDANYV